MSCNREPKACKPELPLEGGTQRQASRTTKGSAPPPHHCNHDGVVAGPPLEDLFGERRTALGTICRRCDTLLLQHALPGGGSCRGVAATSSPGPRCSVLTSCRVLQMPFRTKTARHEGRQDRQQQEETARRHLTVPVLLKMCSVSVDPFIDSKRNQSIAPQRGFIEELFIESLSCPALCPARPSPSLLLSILFSLHAS